MSDKKEDIIPLGKAVAILITVIVGTCLLIGGGFYFFMAGPWPAGAKQPRVDWFSEEISEEGLSAENAGAIFTGTWATEKPNHNGETTVISFDGGQFTMVTELPVAADKEYVYEQLETVDAYYDDYNGGPIAVEHGTDGTTLVRSTVRGSFSLTENELTLVGEDGSVAVLPLSYTQEEIVIDEERFVRKR